MGGNNNGGGCSLCRLINMLISLAFLGAGGYMIWYFLGQPDVDDIQGYWENFDGFGDFGDVLGNLSNFDFGDLYDTDPFLSDNSTNSWPTKGEGGLELEMVNALDDTWQDEFKLAIDDWENGTPDPLTLTVTRGEVDYVCTQQDGVQKVCSGNYGDTGWLGINEILKIREEIQSSVAKMNEYYLRNADNPKRQYTMCHEIGHGFGLPHTDESFTNPSLGNCMDYTNWPEENMHPDESNYKRLASLYGTVGRRRLGNSKETRRTDRRRLPEDLRNVYEDTVAEIELLSTRRSLSTNAAGSHWVLEEDTSHGSKYSRYLGEDYSIEVHLLHTQPLN